MCAKYHRFARGEIVTVDDTKIEFLYVPDDCSILNTAGRNANLCSLIFNIKGKDKKVMITRDAYCVDFYSYVDSQIVFMPRFVVGYCSVHSELYDKSEGCIANLCVETKTEEVYKVFNGMAEMFI